MCAPRLDAGSPLACAAARSGILRACALSRRGRCQLTAPSRVPHMGGVWRWAMAGPGTRRSSKAHGSGGVLAPFALHAAACAAAPSSAHSAPAENRKATRPLGYDPGPECSARTMQALERANLALASPAVLIAALPCATLQLLLLAAPTRVAQLLHAAGRKRMADARPSPIFDSDAEDRTGRCSVVANAALAPGCRRGWRVEGA
jgi:hypothetical protein